MPGLYIGGSGNGVGPVGPIDRGTFTYGNSGKFPTPPSWNPVTPPAPPTSNPVQSPGPNVLGAQAVRPTGPSAGFDPSYLQNLATAIGGLFSRPQGNLSFNPLGNLSEISPPTGFGTAPVPGLPNTMLQDAINGLSFMFQPPAPPSTSGSSFVGSGGGGGGDNGGRRSPLAY